jgi:hypothetical protein
MNEQEKESVMGYGVDRGPSRTTTWPPAWLTVPQVLLETEVVVTQTPLESDITIEPEVGIIADHPRTIADQGDWWDCLDDEQRAELLTPRSRPGRCYFCGGIYHHAVDCFGQPCMPWGKYEGRRLAEVPQSYLEWAAGSGYGRVESRESFAAELRRRFAP